MVEVNCLGWADRQQEGLPPASLSWSLGMKAGGGPNTSRWTPGGPCGQNLGCVCGNKLEEPWTPGVCSAGRADQRSCVVLLREVQFGNTEVPESSEETESKWT